MIESILIAEDHGSPQVEVDEVEVVAGKGIVGDRNFGENIWTGQNITFIEAEEIESFNARYNRSVAKSEMGRNIVTRSVRLNTFVGSTFFIGEVQFYGVELCEPCQTLGNRLAATGMPPAMVVRAWLHKGGLRADVLDSGILRVGMHFHVRTGV